jgi:hypothetical protein
MPWPTISITISTSMSIWTLDAVAHDLDVLIGQPLEDRRVVRRAAFGRHLWGKLGGAPL